MSTNPVDKFLRQQAEFNSYTKRRKELIENPLISKDLKDALLAEIAWETSLDNRVVSSKKSKPIADGKLSIYQEKGSISTHDSDGELCEVTE